MACAREEAVYDELDSMVQDSISETARNRVAVLVVNDDTSIIASILDPQTRQLAFTFEQGDDVTVEDMYAGLRARGIDTDNKDLFTINNCLVTRAEWLWTFGGMTLFLRVSQQRRESGLPVN